MSKSISNRELFSSIKTLIKDAQQYVVRNVNTTMLITYFEIGRMIVENEQSGKHRAGYAKEIIPQLSNYLTKEFGRGYSTSNLEYFRKFYILYKIRISQSLIGKSTNPNKSQSTTAKSILPTRLSEITQSLIGKSKLPFSLSWTHYVQLIKIENEDERNVYEIEATQNNWSVRELTRQFNAAIYERVALSKDKKGVKELAKKGQIRSIFTEKGEFKCLS